MATARTWRFLKRSTPNWERSRAFRNCASCRLLATWDDHDYGVNDGGREYPQREASQRVFLDFFGDPADSERHNGPGYTRRT